MSHVTSSLTPVTADAISCSQCGYQNAGWRSSCERCKADLGQPGRPALPALALVDRPGCLTIYVLFIALGAIMIALAGLVILAEGELVALFVISWGLLQGTMAHGLWKMRNWARIGMICLLAVGLIITVVGVTAGATIGATAIPVNCYVLYWLASNGERFA